MTRRPRPSNTPLQPGLFDPPVHVPQWDALAPDIRTTVTTLIARMLRAHWEREDERPPREADCE